MFSPANLSPFTVKACKRWYPQMLFGNKGKYMKQQKVFTTNNEQNTVYLKKYAWEDQRGMSTMIAMWHWKLVWSILLQYGKVRCKNHIVNNETR